MAALWERLSKSAHECFSQCAGFVKTEWQHMTPTKYGILLILIFAVGYLLLRSGNRRI